MTHLRNGKRLLISVEALIWSVPSNSPFAVNDLQTDSHIMLCFLRTSNSNEFKEDKVIDCSIDPESDDALAF